METNSAAFRFLEWLRMSVFFRHILRGNIQKPAQNLRMYQSWKRRKQHYPPLQMCSHKHTYSLGLPGSTGPKCSAAGDGGGEGGKFVVSSTTKGNSMEKMKERKRFWTQDRYKVSKFVANLTTQELFSRVTSTIAVCVNACMYVWLT